MSGLLGLLALGLASSGALAEEQDSKVFHMGVHFPADDPPEDVNAVVAYVMAQHGYRTEFPLVPSRRLPWSLSNGSIDALQDSVYSREVMRAGHEQNFIRSKYPIFNYTVLAYYKPSQRWRPDSPGDQAAFKGGRGVSINHTYLDFHGYNITLIPGWESGVRMVNSGRADFWLDSFPVSALIGILGKEEDGYRLEKYMDSPLFLYFKDNERGRHFREIWDTEIQKLYNNPNLYSHIFLEKLRNDYYRVALGQFLDYLRRTYPEFADAQQD